MKKKFTVTVANTSEVEIEAESAREAAKLVSAALSLGKPAWPFAEIEASETGWNVTDSFETE